MSWDLHVFRGDLNADEDDWEPLDAHVPAEVFNRIEHTERDSDDEWGGAVFLQLRTFSFQGKVRICVTDPQRRRVCRSFQPRPRPEGVYEIKVRWHRNYPNGGRGRYRVGFFLGTTRLGPVLDFRLR